MTTTPKTSPRTRRRIVQAYTPRRDAANANKALRAAVQNWAEALTAMHSVRYPDAFAKHGEHSES